MGNGVLSVPQNPERQLAVGRQAFELNHTLSLLSVSVSSHIGRNADLKTEKTRAILPMALILFRMISFRACDIDAADCGAASEANIVKNGS